jgi:hypothetical protein
MSVDRERLKATLDELHQQLAQLDEVDPPLRNQLGATLHEIQTTLHSESPAEASLVDRLREAARDFEESHPALSGTIGSLIDTLGRTGI